MNSQRALDKIRRGQLPGPEMSTAKLALTNSLHAYTDWVAEVLGPRMTADGGGCGVRPRTPDAPRGPRHAHSRRYAAVMRNIVAEQVLGLPKDPGVDATTPFKDMASNSRG